jgi:hypothetical protein
MRALSAEVMASTNHHLESLTSMGLIFTHHLVFAERARLARRPRFAIAAEPCLLWLALGVGEHLVSAKRLGLSLHFQC